MRLSFIDELMSKKITPDEGRKVLLIGIPVTVLVAAALTTCIKACTAMMIGM